MKLVNHEGLMAMPQGTIFQEFGKLGLGTPQVFGGALLIRGEPIDYICAELLPTESPADVGHPPEILAKFGVNKSDYAIWYPGGFGRDALYDKTRHYLVWEQQDRERIVAWILDPEKAASEMNDDALAMIAVDWDIRARSA